MRGGRSVFHCGQVREIVKAKQNTVKAEVVPLVLERLKILPMLKYLLRLLKSSECLETEIGVVTICHHDSLRPIGKHLVVSLTNYVIPYFLE